MNLLENALKFSPDGEPRARACDDDAQRGARPRGRPRAGHPRGELERIFEPFEPRSGEADERSGSGLGLAIARGFAEAKRRAGLGRVAARDRARRSSLALPLVEVPVEVGA